MMTLRKVPPLRWQDAKWKVGKGVKTAGSSLKFLQTVYVSKGNNGDNNPNHNSDAQSAIDHKGRDYVVNTKLGLPDLYTPYLACLCKIPIYCQSYPVAAMPPLPLALRSSFPYARLHDFAKYSMVTV